MDRFFSSIYSVPYFKDYIERICIYYWNDGLQGSVLAKDSILRVYPAEDMQNPKYSLYGFNTINESYWYYAELVYNKSKSDYPQYYGDYPFIVLNGPYQDVKMYGEPLLSFNVLYMEGIKWRGNFCYIMLLLYNFLSKRVDTTGNEEKILQFLYK